MENATKLKKNSDMKKLLGILVLGFLISSCESAEDKAFNNCLEDLKGRIYEGKEINEFVATAFCQEIKRELPEMFKRSKGKIREYLINRGN